MRDIFTNIYKHNLWSGRQSRSGTGSDLEETLRIRQYLPGLLKSLGIKSMLDIPCGDMNWMSSVAFPHPFEYIGGDIVPEIIEDNRRKYDLSRMEFVLLDIVSDTLPEVDLIFTRDCLGHLSSDNVYKAVENIKKAKPKYFIATHWPTADKADIEDGGWRPINMNHYLGNEFELVELVREDLDDKYLGVWAYESNR